MRGMAPAEGSESVSMIRIRLASLRIHQQRVFMDLEHRIKHLKELIPLLPIRKTIPLQRELVQLEKKLKERDENNRSK